jgi:high-affinity iron transporter
MATIRGEHVTVIWAGVDAGALVATAFLAVGREGLETALFVWVRRPPADDGARHLAGAVLGLLTAVVLG